VQTLPFDPRFNTVGDAAVAVGAAGYVGLLTGVPRQTRDYYVPYDAQPRPLSGLWLTRSDGDRLLRLLGGGACRGRLSVDCRQNVAVDHNVLGHLPGPGAETVIIGSHHDAPWASAVEDASGMALVLAQAAYWAATPAAERPHNLTFLLAAGHMAGGAGTRSFVDRHAASLADTVLEVHLEHAAAEVRGDSDRLLRRTAGAALVVHEYRVRPAGSRRRRAPRRGPAPLPRASAHGVRRRADDRRQRVLPRRGAHRALPDRPDVPL
jgi:hypothetical protein